MCTKQCLIDSIDMLRIQEWEQALKYRYDPVIGKIHEKLLKNLNDILEYAKTHEEINV